MQIAVDKLLLLLVMARIGLGFVGGVVVQRPGHRLIHLDIPLVAVVCQKLA